jgi:hypothetical protein
MVEFCAGQLDRLSAIAAAKASAIAKRSRDRERVIAALQARSRSRSASTSRVSSPLARSQSTSRRSSPPTSLPTSQMHTPRSLSVDSLHVDRTRSASVPHEFTAARVSDYPVTVPPSVFDDPVTRRQYESMEAGATPSARLSMPRHAADSSVIERACQPTFDSHAPSPRWHLAAGSTNPGYGCTKCLESK